MASALIAAGISVRSARTLKPLEMSMAIGLYPSSEESTFIRGLSNVDKSITSTGFSLMWFDPVSVIFSANAVVLNRENTIMVARARDIKRFFICLFSFAQF